MCQTILLASCTCAKLKSLKHVNKHYEMHFATQFKLLAHLNKKHKQHMKMH
jgi:hypothetical protein